MHVLEDVSFYLLVMLAAFSLPLLEYRGDFLTLFDFYLLLFLVIKGVTSGFAIGGTHWKALGVVFAAYLVYLTIGALRVRTPAALLLALKHFEYAAFLLVLVDRLERRAADLHHRDVWFLLALLFAVVVYQVAFYYQVLPGIGDIRSMENRRLGLPLMSGVSSNPAGLFLTAAVVMLFNLCVRNPRYVIPSVVVGVVAIWALMLTGSRTNVAVLGVVCPLSIVAAVWRTRFRWLVVGLLVVGVALFLTVGVHLLPTDGSIGRITRMLSEPAAMIEEPSFTIRVDSWISATATWLHDLPTFFFGVGLSSLGATDGTIPRVLAEQGIVGLLLFLYVWYAHYVRFERSQVVLLLLFVTLMNGVFGETLVVSYRTVQLYLVLLYIGLLVEHKQGDPKAIGFDELLAALRRFWYIVPIPAVLAPLGLLFFAGSTPAFESPALETTVYVFAGFVVGILSALIVHSIIGVRR